MVVDEVYWFVGSFLGAKAYNFTPYFWQKMLAVGKIFSLQGLHL